MDERRHRPTDDRWWGEAWTFEFATLDGRLGGYVRLELLPNQRTCWYWAWVVGPGRPPVVVLDEEVPLPRGASLELRTTGLWADHIVEEPYEHVSVGAEAFALCLDDAAEALGPLVGAPTPFGLDLGWETAGEQVGRLRRAPAAAAGTVDGYTLDCDVVGEVLVADERIEVGAVGEMGAVGQRRHTWGVEDWWSAGWTAVHGRLDDGTWFAGQVSATAPSTDVGGARGFPTTDRVRLEHPGHGPQHGTGLSGLDGPGMDLAVEPLAFAPVPVEDGGGRRSHLLRALCRFRDRPSGRAGVGWTEWNRPL